MHAYVCTHTRVSGDKPTLDYNVSSIFSLWIMPDAVDDRLAYARGV